MRTLTEVSRAIVDCDRCPRLRQYCLAVAQTKKRAHAHETYWGRPVPGFGDPEARILLVALAPAAHGANRTGRVFTGDGASGSSEFLMAALHRAGLASQPTSTHAGDGLTLRDAYITSAVRCAPPGNAPSPDERARCLDHLDAEVALLPRVRVVVALGQVAFEAWLRRWSREGIRLRPRPRFGHGVRVEGGDGRPVLVGCYHPSRQNTNTGTLTARMMDVLFEEVLRIVTARRSNRP